MIRVDERKEPFGRANVVEQTHTFVVRDHGVVIAVHDQQRRGTRPIEGCPGKKLRGPRNDDCGIDTLIETTSAAKKSGNCDSTVRMTDNTHTRAVDHSNQCFPFSS